MTADAATISAGTGGADHDNPAAADVHALGRAGVWLLIAADVMFFAGLLAAFLVLRAGNARLFAAHSASLNHRTGAAGVVLLLVSSGAVALSVRLSRHRAGAFTAASLAVGVLLAAAFCWTQFDQWDQLLGRHTTVALDAGANVVHVYDGRYESAPHDTLALHGYRAPVPAGASVDAYALAPADVPRLAGARGPDDWGIPVASISQDLTYGPWKNVFYACYFTLAGVHAVHLLAAMCCVAVRAVAAATGGATATRLRDVALFWHFAVAAWLVLYPMLYLAR